VEFASDAAENQGLKVVTAGPTLGGEDFAYYQEKIKGAFIEIGIGDTYPLHHPKFQVDKRALIHSSQLFAAIAEKALIKLS
jgi:metal-dependent amidase/aminoacylase/carboxypeptidase family protein